MHKKDVLKQYGDLSQNTMHPDEQPTAGKDSGHIV